MVAFHCLVSTAELHVVTTGSTRFFISLEIISNEHSSSRKVQNINFCLVYSVFVLMCP